MFRMSLFAVLMAALGGCGCPVYFRAPGSIMVTVLDAEGEQLSSFEGAFRLVYSNRTSGQQALEMRCPADETGWNGRCVAGGFEILEVADEHVSLMLELSTMDGEAGFSGEVALEKIEEDFIAGPFCMPARNGWVTVKLLPR